MGEEDLTTIHIAQNVNHALMRRVAGAMVRPVPRLHHLRTLAERVLARYDLHGASLTLVSETANAVFHVKVPSGRPQRLVETGMTRDGAAYALRLRPPGWHRTQPMAEELQWLLALRRDTDLVVPEPVPACDGTLIQDISAPDTSEPWQGVLFHWVAGERRTDSNSRRPVKASIHQAFPLVFS